MDNNEGVNNIVVNDSTWWRNRLPNFEIEKILDIKFSKIEIKKMEDRDIEYTHIFGIILSNFNQAYGKTLTADELLYSRSSFDAFMLFLMSCIMKRYLVIREECESQFMKSLKNLRRKYNQNLRSIDIYYDIIVEKIFYPKGLTKKDQEVREHMYFFDQAYSLVKIAFKDEKRDNGERYFEHLKGVMDILIWEMPGVNLHRIIIGLLHYIQEDMPEYADSIRILYGDYIADGVNALSKKPWEDYLTDGELEECGESLARKREILDLATTRIIEKYPDKSFMAKRKFKEKELIPYMTLEEFEQYLKIELYLKPFMEPAKERRNQDYFGHLDELNDDYLSVKFADRIHNLRDINGVTKEKAKRKIEETEKYFLEVAKRRSPEAYNLMVAELEELRKVL